MGSLFVRALVGGFAGLLAWMLIEPTNPGLSEMVAWSMFEQRLIFTLGALIGLSVGGYNGFLKGGRVHILRGLGLGCLFGLVAAPLGYGIGGALSQIFGGVQADKGMLNIIPRTVALTPLGAALGFGIGLSSLDVKRAIHGAIGGAIGAAAGALVFDLVGTLVSGAVLFAQGTPAGQSGEVGQLPRAIFAVSMGALIGLFIGLVEYLARNAWVRLTLGRNEGREWAIYSAQTVIGRRENNQIPIFGDPGIAPAHAMIVKQGRDFFLQDLNSGMPTFLNGQPISNAALHHGAEIVVGNTRLHFLLKGGKAFRPMPDAAGMRAGYMGYGVPQQYPAQPHPHPMAPSQPGSPSQMQPMAPVPMPPTQMQPMAPVPVPPPHTMQPTVAVPAQPQGASAMVAVDGPLAGQRVQLNQPMELGRESTALPMSFDSSASRKHATIAPTPGGIVVNDLGSTNGTFVNGQRISSPTTIRPGDTVKIGATTFRIE